jgi:hypothetical protein
LGAAAGAAGEDFAGALQGGFMGAETDFAGQVAMGDFAARDWGFSEVVILAGEVTAMAVDGFEGGFEVEGFHRHELHELNTNFQTTGRPYW